MHNPYIEISGRKIGKDFKPLVIAELGINHNGSLEEAYKIVDVAYSHGAEIIKHQTHIVEDEMSSEAKKVIPSHTKDSIYKIMEECALSEDDEQKLMEYIKEKNMIFISTPFSRKAANRLEKFDIPAYKIGSGECNNYPLIEHIATFGKPMIISTGMNSINSIKPTVDILRKNKIQYALLHCTNIYPTPNELVRLNCIKELEDVFDDAVIGLSDHTIDEYACLGAVALGASILERHFTDTKNREGPDISCSMDGPELVRLMDGSNKIFLSRGGNKAPLDDEKNTIDFAFASVVTIKDIAKGEILTKENIWVKRPGTGDFLAKDFANILGKKTIKEISKDILLKKSDIK